MHSLSEIAYAKINLALHVRRRRDDGYHELETLFAFADRGDVLTAEPASELTLDITGPFALGLSAADDNLVLRAANALQKPGQGARLVLTKNLPIASGIGGGSADAAAALRLLARLWNSDHDLMPIAAALGADVPACLGSVTALGIGTGAELSEISNILAGTPMLLLNPGIPLATGPVFMGWSGFDHGPLPHGTVHDIALYGRNDLEASAMDLVPEIAMAVELLRASGAYVARMSGSGATCFGLYHDAASRDVARAEISRKQPDWWQMPGSLR
jgi:4-diphosphocytidyl-2-C-methyl-D-erythritol kinase